MGTVMISLIGGLALGGTYALIGLGIVIAFRATGTFSFAQGQLMALAALYVGMWQLAGWSVGIAMIVAVALVAAIYLVFFLVFLQRLVGHEHFVGLVATLGLAAILDAVLALVFGANRYSIEVPALATGVTSIFGARITTASLILTIASIIIAIVIAVVLRYTHLGIRLRAAGHDPVLASQGGINVRRIYAGAWALSGALAGLAGLAYGSTNLVDVSLSNVALTAIPAVVLGGMDSIEGAIIGGLLIGVMQGFVTSYLGAEPRDAITYALLLVVLLLRPNGILGTRRIARV